MKSLMDYLVNPDIAQSLHHLGLVYPHSLVYHASEEWNGLHSPSDAVPEGVEAWPAYDTDEIMEALPMKLYSTVHTVKAGSELLPYEKMQVESIEYSRVYVILARRLAGIWTIAYFQGRSGPIAEHTMTSLSRSAPKLQDAAAELLILLNTLGIVPATGKAKEVQP